MDMLSVTYRLLHHDFYPTSKSQTLLKFFSQAFFLFRNIGQADILICQFASYHSLLPALVGKIVGKPCLVIVGGTDAHYYPILEYGNWQKRVLKTATALTFKWCSHIAPKHSTLMQSENLYDTSEPRLQGIYTRLPQLKTPFTAITNGYDASLWKSSTAKIPRTFITVCSGWEFSFQYQLKGIDLIVAIAPLFPDCKFIIAGVPDENLIQHRAANLEIRPPVKHEQLAAMLSSCAYYLQLSIAEGFPNSLCEAMLCNCVPIGSNVYSIPEIIGKSGFVLAHRNIEELKRLIQEALQADIKLLGGKARARIVENYPLALREQKLMALIEKLIEAN